MFSRFQSAAARLLMSPDERVSRAANQLGLRCVENPDVVAYYSASNEAQRILQHEGMSALERRYMDAHKSGAKLHTWIRHYVVIEDIVDNLMDDEAISMLEMEITLEGFRQAWEDADRSPFASAMYAKALYNMGFAHRGGDWAANVSRNAWQKFADHINEAHDVFEQSADRAADCPIWYRMLHAIALADGCGRDELQGRFEDARVFDPYEFRQYTTHAHALMPRWHGSAEEIEAHAHEAVGHTHERLGCMVYSRIYAEVGEFEDKSDMLADWDLLKRGFRDWYRLTGTQYVLNVFADFAHHHGDGVCLRELLSGEWHSIHDNAWSDADRTAEVLEDCARL